MGDFMEEIFNSLTRIIKEHNNILIMTHKNPDFDGMGAAFGLQQIINSFNKTSYICINNIEKNNSLNKAYKLIKEKNLYLNTINKSAVKNIIDDDTLLIILDTHKKQMTEIPQLVDKVKNIVIIDHHVKSKDYIKNYNLCYINSGLSSTVEFITNYIKYLNKTIDSLFSTFMLVGLEIDTNNFRLKTNENTYEAAAHLIKLGADNILKQELLQENKEIYLKRQKLISKSFMVNSNMILCIADEKIYENKDLAEIAEDLLQFENVEASFVIGKITNNIVGISARSIGKINVEKIMSKLGGGGHYTEAATQIKNKTIKDVQNLLLEQIKEEK